MPYNRIDTHVHTWKEFHIVGMLLPRLYSEFLQIMFDLLPGNEIIPRLYVTASQLCYDSVKETKFWTKEVRVRYIRREFDNVILVKILIRPVDRFRVIELEYLFENVPISNGEPLFSFQTS